MIASIVSSLDTALAAALPEAARLAIWAVLSGVVSMAIYAWTSPQQRLRDLKAQTAGLQQQLAAYDGDFGGAMILTRQNLALAFRRLGWALFPALIAGVPVVLVLVGMVDVYTGSEIIPFGPAWLRSWLTAYFAGVTVAALGTKFVCRID